MKANSMTKIYKRIAALLKSADVVYCDKTKDFFYLSESHTIYKVPVTAETENIFEAMFEDRRTKGRRGMDGANNSGNMEKAFSENTKGDFINYEIIGLMNKSGLLSHAAYLIQHDEKTHKVINSKFLDVFKGFDFSVGAVNLSDKYPAVVHCEPVEAVLLPIKMDLETAKKNIARSIEENAENAKKTKGLYYNCGRDCWFIPKGKKDLKTINKIISFLCDKIGADDENREKFYQDSKLHESIKKNCVNVTMEIKNDEAGDYYYLTDTKTFFFFNPVVWSETINDGIIKFIVAPEDRAAFNKELFEADRRPAAAKTETAAEDQEPAEAADDITPEPAEDIPAEAADDPAETAEKGPAMPSTNEEILASLKARRARFITALSEADPEGTDSFFDSMRTDLRCMEEEIAEREDNAIPPDIVSRALSAAAEATKNTSAIIKAGIAAEAFTAAELLDFIEKDILPAVHTFSGWMAAGYTVKKGEKALFKADIWQKFKGTYYKHTAAFFGPAQVEAIPEGGK